MGRSEHWFISLGSILLLCFGCVSTQAGRKEMPAAPTHKIEKTAAKFPKAILKAPLNYLSTNAVVEYVDDKQYTLGLPRRIKLDPGHHVIQVDFRGAYILADPKVMEFETIAEHTYKIESGIKPGSVWYAWILDITDSGGIPMMDTVAKVQGSFTMQPTMYVPVYIPK